ncbi:Lrp/AsnC family transcriptional regulator [uncultured Jannaschia sp.]|uniref:Lrp/AsnC family transcriptional regulator n=1 Tax=uncultured Jannaschia sp. TaxID=293347 RepID=UPI0026157474|nr:Lrp/AsnC family transcriptional regulator [uncultured Jannaschia sp.]
MSRVRLDATDIRILDALQRHGRLSKARLAGIVNLSPTPAWSRLARLEAVGLVRGYHADIAIARIADVTQVVVTLSLARHRRADFDRFEAYVRDCDAVTDCIATGGGMDYVLTFVCPDLAAFQLEMDAMLAAELGVERYFTYIVTREVKRARPTLSRLIESGDQSERSAIRARTDRPD